MIKHIKCINEIDLYLQRLTGVENKNLPSNIFRYWGYFTKINIFVECVHFFDGQVTFCINLPSRQMSYEESFYENAIGGILFRILSTTLLQIFCTILVPKVIVTSIIDPDNNFLRNS